MYERPKTVYDRFKKLLKAFASPDIRFHDFRHSYATALLDLDVPLKVISKILAIPLLTSLLISIVMFLKRKNNRQKSFKTHSLTRSTL